MANPGRYAAVDSGHSRPPDSATEEDTREWYAAELRTLWARHESGDTWALFLAVQFCARWQIALPPAFAQAIQQAMDRYQFAEVRELGEAFGITRPKNWNHVAAREWHRKALPVFYWIEARIGEGATVPDVFAEAAKVAGISPKRAEEYFYAIRANHHPAKE